MAITIAQARELLGPAAEGKSDEHIAGLLAQAYHFGREIIGAYQAHRLAERAKGTSQ